MAVFIEWPFISGSNGRAGSNSTADTLGNLYRCFRIPVLVRLKTRLIAFAECRGATASGTKPAIGCPGGDHSSVRICNRISDDDGATWGPLRQVELEAGSTIGNPLAIADEQANLLHLFFTKDNRDIFYTRSRDGGVSFGARANLTATLKPWLNGSLWIGAGPSAGAQLLPSGRLVGVANAMDGNRVDHAFSILSDDHGSTWQRGGFVGNANTTGTGEAALALLQSLKGDGPRKPTLAMLLRASDGDSRAPQVHNRWLTYSEDGGRSWSNATPALGMDSPSCASSLLSLDSRRLLASSPYGPSRRNMTLWSGRPPSLPGPSTWTAERQILAGPAGYSSIIRSGSSGSGGGPVGGATEVLVLFEAGYDDACAGVNNCPYSLALSRIAV